MYPVALRDEIRTWVLIQGKSQRAASRHFGLSRNTIAKLLLEEPAESVRHYQRQAQPKTPVRDAALSHIQKWLQENEWLERWAPKQCWTAHRMWTELRKLGIPIGESTVRLFVQELRTSSKPAYVPLDFAPGERAEFDFGEATVKLSGQVVKVPFLAGRLRFSGAMFVECFPTQRQEAFLLGQRHAFEFWGGVPRIAVYDNLKPAVLQVLQGHSRREHDVFLHFQSVYRGDRALCQYACRLGERKRRKSGRVCSAELPRAASRGNGSGGDQCRSASVLPFRSAAHHGQAH